MQSVVFAAAVAGGCAGESALQPPPENSASAASPTLPSTMESDPREPGGQSGSGSPPPPCTTVSRELQVGDSVPGTSATVAQLIERLEQPRVFDWVTYTGEFGTYHTSGEEKREVNALRLALARAQGPVVFHDSTAKEGQSEASCPDSLSLPVSVKLQMDQRLDETESVRVTVAGTSAHFTIVKKLSQLAGSLRPDYRHIQQYKPGFSESTSNEDAELATHLSFDVGGGTTGDGHVNWHLKRPHLAVVTAALLQERP